MSLEILTKSICLEISASLGEKLPKAAPWTAFYFAGGMELSLSSAFLRQWVRYLTLYAIKCKNPCRRQFGNSLPHLHQGGRLFTFGHFSQAQEHGEEKNGKQVRAKDSSGLISDAFMGPVQPFLSPLLSLSKALRVLIRLARQAALQRAGHAFELGSIVI